MQTVRPAAVAGLFYPHESSVLRADIERYLASVLVHEDVPERLPRALIVPHAGFIYSGPVAASAYAQLSGHTYRRILILGPSHRVAFQGIALPTVQSFMTPLGEVALDQDSMRQLEHRTAVCRRDDAHALEHCIEVQLPFLQAMLGSFTLIPAVVGQCSAQQVFDFIHAVRAVDADMLIVISSDLSHYLPYDQACRKDRDTIHQIEHFHERHEVSLHGDQACGAYPLNGFLHYADSQHWRVQCVDYRNSGDTAGTRDKVVGYASFIAG